MIGGRQIGHPVTGVMLRRPLGHPGRTYLGPRADEIGMKPIRLPLQGRVRITISLYRETEVHMVIIV